MRRKQHSYNQGNLCKSNKLWKLVTIICIICEVIMILGFSVVTPTMPIVGGIVIINCFILRILIEHYKFIDKNTQNKKHKFERLTTAICIVYEIVLILGIFPNLETNVLVYSILIVINCIITWILLIHWKVVNVNKRYKAKYIDKKAGREGIYQSGSYIQGIYEVETFSETQQLKNNDYPYIKKCIATQNEYIFYERLKKIIEKTNYIICPKVGLKDIADITNKEEKMKYFGKISQNMLIF